MTKYFTTIVVPCLNEERNLAATCRSLGFGVGKHPPSDAALILVDNGSEDATLSVAKGVQAASPKGSVIVTTEPDRGYVPPRRRGNLVAMSEAADRGVSKQHLLIVQADADTIYNEGYVEAIEKDARRIGLGAMIEARSEFQAEFVDEYSEYFALCNEVDREFEAMLSNQSNDVIIDDKTCAYWASDYELWGEHRREFTSQGEEIYSESTRLYIRARTFGVSRYLCDDAVAQHSGRRILAEPAYSFATAGFPRERAFKTKWNQLYHGPDEIKEFCKQENRSRIVLPLCCRRAHLQGLFQTLTVHLRLALDETADLRSGNESDSADELPKRDVQTAQARPGLLLEDVFAIIDGCALPH
jgi:glycosyltransferase involved in cell wall biosynthesis